MTDYDNTNRGTISKNSRKSKDTDADIAGQINVDGKEYWLNGWQKQNRTDGSTFYSLSVKPKEARQVEASQSQPTGGYGANKARVAPSFEEDPDAIPF